MRTLVALGVVLAFTASAAAAEPGSGRFSAEGAIDLSGLEAASFDAPTVVVFTTDEAGLAFDFVASHLVVERVWTDNVYVEGQGPLAAAWQPIDRYEDSATFVDAAGSLDAVTEGPQPTAFLAYGDGAVGTLAPPRSAAIVAAKAGSADPYGNVADVRTGEPSWWRPDVDVPLHVATSLEDAVITLTGDFDVYIFQADWSVNGNTFRTGIVENGPGHATVERDILHFRGATLTLRAAEADVLATALTADIAGTLRLDEASGYYEEDGTRWEARDLPALLQGTFRVTAEAADARTTALALSGDLVHMSLNPVATGATFVPSAGTAAAATTGLLAVVAGSVLLARRGRERWIAGHVETPQDCVERALRASAGGREAEALRWYRRARALAPQDALLALDEGHAADAVGDAAAARRAYEDALKLDPDLAEGHLRYARVLALQGLQPAALSHLGRALALEPALAAEVPGDAAFAPWRDHPRFADLLRNYRGGRA